MMFAAGCFAFALMISADYFELYGKKKISKILFFTGIVLFFLSCAGLVCENFTKGARVLWVRLVFTGLGTLFFTLLLHALFFAIPFKSTYIKPGASKTVKSGVYSICRHPGVWWLTLMLLCFWISLDLPLYAAVVYSFLDFLYAYIEDRFIFPYSLEGYREYKTEVPFLIPGYSRRKIQRKEGKR